MKGAKELLGRLHKRIPTEGAVRHNITTDENKIFVTVYLGCHGWISYVIEEEDLEETVDWIYDSIIQSLRERGFVDALAG